MGRNVLSRIVRGRPHLSLRRGKRVEKVRMVGSHNAGNAAAARVIERKLRAEGRRTSTKVQTGGGYSVLYSDKGMRRKPLERHGYPSKRPSSRERSRLERSRLQHETRMG